LIPGAARLAERQQALIAETQSGVPNRVRETAATCTGSSCSSRGIAHLSIRPRPLPAAL